MNTDYDEAMQQIAKDTGNDPRPLRQRRSKQDAKSKARELRTLRALMRRTVKADALAKAYLMAGGNTVAASKIAKNLGAITAKTDKVAAQVMFHESNTSSFRNRVVSLLEQQGLTPATITQRVVEAMGAIKLNAVGCDPADFKNSITLFNMCLTHLRAILGLDAAKSIHHQVDKRSITLTGSADKFKELASKAKYLAREKGLTADNSMDLPAAIMTPVNRLHNKSDNDTDSITDHTLSHTIPSKLTQLV